MVVTEREGAKGYDSGQSTRYAGASCAEEVRHAIQQRVCSAWPKLKLDPNQFISHLQLLLEHDLQCRAEVDRLAIEDLALAFACSQREPAALQTFRSEYEPEFRAIAAQFRLSEVELGDLRQAVWDRLFVGGADGRPKIVEYRGAGGLRYWLRAVATRQLLDKARRTRPVEKALDRSDVRMLGIAASDTDVELAVMKKRYGEHFRSAFEAAVAALEPEERNAIRCHHLLGMTVSEIAAAFGTHRATAARRVSRARARLQALTRANLKAQIGADTSELESIMRLYDGEASITLSRLFAPTG